MDAITIIFNLVIYALVPLTLIAIAGFILSLLIKIIIGAYYLLAAPLLLVGINISPKSQPNEKDCNLL
jgi:hypothetical protein